MIKNLVSNPLQRVLSSFFNLSHNDLDVLSNLEQRRLTLRAREDLSRPSVSGAKAYFLTGGWALSFKILHDGSRQILDCPIPGDILGFRNIHVQAADSFIEPLTTIDVIEFKVSDLQRAIADRSILSQSLLWFLARDYAILGEHLVNNGRRGALERTAHFFLEMGVRMRQAGMADAHDYACPLTQYLLADILGLSAVHINRTLRQLRERDLVTYRNGRVTITNPVKLAELCGFNPDYLTPKLVDMPY